MKTAWLWVLVIALGAVATTGLAQSTKEKERLARQADLDAACESARQKAIAAARTKYVEECVAKKQRPDRPACERFYADYGQSSATGAPLFYDLPECEAAHRYRTSYRN